MLRTALFLMYSGFFFSFLYTEAPQTGLLDKTPRLGASFYPSRGPAGPMMTPPLFRRSTGGPAALFFAFFRPARRPLARLLAKINLNSFKPQAVG